MFCEKCGTQNADGARFCATCGALLEQQTYQGGEDQNTTVLDPSMAPPYGGSYEQPQEYAQPQGYEYSQPQSYQYTAPQRARNIATPSKVMLIICSVLSLLSAAAFFIPFTFSKEGLYTVKFYIIISIFDNSFKSDMSRVNGIILLIMFIIASVAAVAAVITAFLRFKAAGALALGAAVFSFGLNFDYFFGFIGYMSNLKTYEMYGSGYTPVPLFIFILAVAAIVVSALALSKYRLKN